MPARQYSSQAVQTTLVGNISAGATTIPVGSVTGFPSTFPYTLVLDKGTSDEEIIEITNASGTSLTAIRAVDGSTALAHSNGALVVHAVTARDLREPQNHIFATSGVHGVVGTIADLTSAQTFANKTMNSPILNTPTIGSFVNAQHAHVNAAGGGLLTYPRCTIRRTATHSITNNTDNTVTLDTSDYQTGGAWWTSGPNVTLPFNGFYYATVQCTFQSAGTNGGIRIAQIKRVSDGLNIAEGNQTGTGGSSSDWFVAQATMPYVGTAGQQFYVNVKQTSGTSMTMFQSVLAFTLIERT